MTDLSTTTEPVPRDRLAGPDGQITRGWRNWFEGNRRQNGEILSGIGELSSAISVNADAIVDINGQLDVYYAISVDGGGNGAFLKLSDNSAYGSAITLAADEITLDADAINFGAQTTFDLDSETFISVTGAVKTRYGSPFGATSNLVRWYGPSSVADGDETLTNGYLAEGTGGERYIGSAAFNWGATAAEAAASNALVPAGVNLCADTGFRGGVQYWQNYTTSGSLNYSDTAASGIRYRQIDITSWGAGAAYAYMAGFPQRGLRVSPGDRVEVQGLMGGTTGLQGEIYVAWLDDTGGWIATSSVQTQVFSLAGGGAQSTYHALGGFATAGSGASWGVPYFQLTGGSAGTIQARIAAPFIAHARASQTALTPLQINNDFQPGADPTGTNTAAAIDGQGLLALGNFYEQTTDPGSVANGSFWSNTGNKSLFIRTGGVWKKIANIGADLSITLDPSSVYSFGSPLGPVVGTATGGAGSNTYAWTWVSGDTFTVTSPTSNSTTFTRGSVGSGVYRLTVTDSLGATAYQDVSITLDSI